MSTDLLGSPLLGERTLIDDLLDEQQLLTPVGKFSRRPEPGDLFKNLWSVLLRQKHISSGRLGS
jgi:hypothetical protein